MMMRWPGWHQRLRKRLAPYLDGELRPDERRRVEAHLAACRACQEELAELRAVTQALRSVPWEEVPRSFALTPGMVAQARADRPSALGRLEAASRLAAAGLAVALAVVLLLDVRGGHEATTQPAAAPPAAEMQALGAPELTPVEGGDERGGSAPEEGVAAPPAATPPPSQGLYQAAPAGNSAQPKVDVTLKKASGEAESREGNLAPVEIGLAAALALAVAVSVAIAIARRRGWPGL